jgi:hypothetical protein
MFGRSVKAEPEERTKSLPGDELIRMPLAAITHAITIRRPPAVVWPWLAQMGATRAGWYSYDVVDNGGRRSADRIVPELQEVTPGTLFPAVPGATDAFILLQYRPEAFLVLGWVPALAAEPITTWAIVLETRDTHRTRLIERGRVRSPYRPYGLPEALARWVGPIAHAIMVRKHLHGLAQRAEGTVAA